MQRSALFLVVGVDVEAVLEEKLNHLEVARVAGVVQAGVAAPSYGHKLTKQGYIFWPWPARKILPPPL